jgi:methyl-accepting chemotaxis protein
MADGSVTIEINGDASEVINSFKQVSSAAEALANNLKGITGSFETVSSASRGMSEGISGSLGDIDTYLNEIDASLNELNNDPFSTAADGAQNLGNSLNDMDSYLDDLESSFDELRNDPFSTNSDGADHLREDLDRLSDSADDAEEDLDRLGDAADDAGDQMDEAGGSASKFGDIFKGTFMGNLAAKGVELAVEAVKKLGEAMIDVGKQAVEAYASYEQNVGGIDTLFKEASGTMQQYAANAYKTAGLSANQYMETATSFAASLVSGLGGDVNKAAEIANRAITDMSDNANKMGTDMQSIQDAYQGFAKQNYTMLDNLKLGRQCHTIAQYKPCENGETPNR